MSVPALFILHAIFASFVCFLPDIKISCILCFWQTRLQIINNWKVVKICDKKHPLLIQAVWSRILVVKDLGRRGGGYWLGGNQWQVLPFTSQANPPLAKSISSLRPKLFCSLKSQNWNRSDFFSCKSGFPHLSYPPLAQPVLSNNTRGLISAPTFFSRTQT